MQKETALAIKLDVPIVVSSGATDRYGLRTPRDLASLLTLVEMDSDLTLQAVSEIPVRIVERNRAKLQSSFVSPGVRIMG
jgi:RNase P/RNase MRP subunit p30